MKVFLFTVVLLAALVQSISAARNETMTEDELDDVSRCCRKQENVDDQFHDTWAPGLVTDKPTYKCFVRCALVKSGTGNDKGEVFVDDFIKASYEVTKTKNSRADMTEIIQNCASAETVAEPCEKAYQFALCVKEKYDKYMKKQQPILSEEPHLEKPTV